ncbi:MAG: HAD hydrolase family protein [Anaeroplasmataceae bacterium]
MPKIGLRIIKTAVSIYICLLLYVILAMINEEFANAWYTPFFAGLAAAYSVHQDKDKSIKQAKNRCIASIIGGIFAILLVLSFEGIMNNFPNINNFLELFIRYTVVAIASIFVIYLTVITKQTESTFVTILTFLSITVGARGGVPSWQFGTNRILSTIIGVSIALSVNLMWIPRRKNKNILYLIDLDGLCKTDKDVLKGYISFKINHMISLGANIFLYTNRTPSSLKHYANEVKINRPVLLLNGAGLYDFNQNKFLYNEKISMDNYNKIKEYLLSLKVEPFVNTVKDDLLFLYKENVNNDIEKDYIDLRKLSTHCTLSPIELKEDDPTYFSIIDKTENIKSLKDKLSLVKDELQICYFDYIHDLNIEYSILKIYSNKVLELNCLDILKKEYELDYVVSFGIKLENSELLDTANKAFELDKHSKFIQTEKALSKCFKTFKHSNKKLEK